MRLIDADAIPWTDLNSDMPNSKIKVLITFADKVNKMPTIEERKKGKWLECDHEKWVVGVHALRCSECNGGYHLNNEMTIYYWNFCPNCGADMRGEEE